jgi:hypothetical protein
MLSGAWQTPSLTCLMRVPFMLLFSCIDSSCRLLGIFLVKLAPRQCAPQSQCANNALSLKPWVISNEKQIPRPHRGSEPSAVYSPLGHTRASAASCWPTNALPTHTEKLLAPPRPSIHPSAPITPAPRTWPTARSRCRTRRPAAQSPCRSRPTWSRRCTARSGPRTGTSCTCPRRGP